MYRPQKVRLFGGTSDMGLLFFIFIILLTSKLISDIPDVDIVISMGCNVGCPFIGRSFDDNWELEDPTGKSDD